MIKMNFLLVIALITSGGVEVEDGLATHYHYTAGWRDVPHVALPGWRFTPINKDDAQRIGALRRMPKVINICNKKTGNCAVALGVDFCGCNGRPKKGDERIADMSNLLVQELQLDWGLGVYKTTLNTTFSPQWLRKVLSFFTEV